MWFTAFWEQGKVSGFSSISSCWTSQTSHGNISPCSHLFSFSWHGICNGFGSTAWACPRVNWASRLEEKWETKMERPQEICHIPVAASIKQCKWQDETDTENISEEGSTSSVFPFLASGLCHVSLLLTEFPRWCDGLLLFQLHPVPGQLYWITRWWPGGISVSAVRETLVFSTRHSNPHTPAALCGTGFTFLLICCYYLLSPLELYKS